MPRYDFRTPRLYVDAPLSELAQVALDSAQANYLGNVLRLRSGAAVLVFNGRDGEWRAMLQSTAKRGFLLVLDERARAQTVAGDIHYWFAPLKHARLDYMVQKAVEMGAASLGPVITRHSQANRVNLDRMRANAILAAEQCGILTLPEIRPPLPFERLVATRDQARVLVFCDEHADVRDPVAALQAARSPQGPTPVDLLVGPEGGFAEEERAALLELPNVVRLTLGPRILRADTAAVAALALVGAVLGDWR